MTTVLLIDPDLSGIAPIRTALEAQGLQVMGAADSHTGLEQARALTPQCILLCVELTGASGYALCNKLRRDPELSRLPLILASSQATPATFEEHSRLRTHADAYLHKPYHLPDVLAAIARFVPLKGLDQDIDSVPTQQGREASPQKTPVSATTLGSDQPLAVVEADAGSVQSGVELADPPPEARVEGATVPLMADVVPDVDPPAPRLKPEAQAMLEEAVDTQSSTQVLKIMPGGRLQPQGRHSAVDLIGEALADLGESQHQNEVPQRQQVLSGPTASEIPMVSNRLELPMEATPSDGPLHPSLAQDVVPSASPEAAGAEPTPFAAEMTAPWQGESVKPESQRSDGDDAPEDPKVAPAEVTGALEEALRDLEEMRSQLAEARSALDASQTEGAEQRALAEQAHAQCKKIQQEYAAMREDMMAMRLKFEEVFKAWDAAR